MSLEIKTFILCDRTNYIATSNTDCWAQHIVNVTVPLYYRTQISILVLLCYMNPFSNKFFSFFLCLNKWLSLLVTIFSPYWIQILEAAFQETLLLCATFSEFSPHSRFNRPPSSWAQFGSERQYCLVVKSHWRLAVWVPISECPLPSWVALGRLFNLAVPQFPNL